MFDVGQGGGTVLLTPNGQAAMIDMGETKGHGEAIASYLLSQAQNGVAAIDTVEFIFAFHYDADHIGGARGLQDKIKAKAVYDQGPSASRDPTKPKGVCTRHTSNSLATKKATVSKIRAKTISSGNSETLNT